MKRTAFRPALRLPAAVLALGLLAGCTAGLGEQPTVTDEPIAATDEDSLPALLANTPTEDVEFYWPNQGSATIPLQEPEPPQMDKQTAANNAAAAFSAAGVAAGKRLAAAGACFHRGYGPGDERGDRSVWPDAGSVAGGGRGLSCRL